MSTARDHLGHELSAEEVIPHLAVMLGWANNAVVPWTVIERDIRELKARAEAAQRDFAACAHAIGVEYEAEGHASRPGPVEDVVSHIEQAAADSLELIDVKREVEQLRKDLHDALGYVSDHHRRAHFARYLVNGELLSTLPATTPADPGALAGYIEALEGIATCCANAWPLPGDWRERLDEARRKAGR